MTSDVDDDALVVVDLDHGAGWEERVEALDQGRVALEELRDPLDHPGRIDVGRLELLKALFGH